MTRCQWVTPAGTCAAWSRVSYSWTQAAESCTMRVCETHLGALLEALAR